jgi:hypothetical protein
VKRSIHRILGRTRATVLTAALLSGAALPAAGLWAGTASAGSVCTVSAGGMVSCTFAYSSSASTWTVPSGVTTLSVVADGGSGAAGFGSPSAAGAGGAGGEYKATLSNIPDGTVLSIFTGAQGSATDGGTDAGSGGGNGTTEETGNNLSGGGGGATTVAISPYSVSNLLVVAGGGGGGAAENNTTTNRPANGGAGGGSSTTSGADGAGTDVGHGGTPTAGGTGGGTAGCPNPAAGGAQLGGGDSANGKCMQAGGGGGSGYHGGGGAAAYGGGGGGSAFPAAATTVSGIDVTPGADASTNTGNGTVTISFAQVNTTTTISSSKNPAAPTDNVTFTAIVTPTDGDGTVAFKDGGGTIGACTTQPLSFVSGSYQATCTVGGLPAGPNTITAVYSGDTAYAGSTSSPLIQNIQTPTATTLSSSLNPSNPGDAVTFTATVNPTDGGGTVGFTDGTADITGCTAQKLTLTAGKYQATCTTSSLPTGADTITAVYGGDTAYAGSTSAPLTQNVRTRTTTTTTITSSKNPGTFGQSVTFTATVTPTDGGGTVGFKKGIADITGCTAQKLTLTAGKYQATCTTSLAVGANKITAIYSGDKAYAGSTSAPLTQTVLRAPTGLTPSITFNNLEETFTVDATLDSLGTPVRGQPLTFTVGPTRLCTATTNSHGTGSCVLTPSQSLLVWRTMGRFTVSYAGTPSYYPSTATNRRGL